MVWGTSHRRVLGTTFLEDEREFTGGKWKSLQEKGQIFFGSVFAKAQGPAGLPTEPAVAHEALGTTKKCTLVPSSA